MNSQELYKVNGSDPEFDALWETEDEEVRRARRQRFKSPQGRRTPPRQRKPVRRPAPRRRRRPWAIQFRTPITAEPQSRDSEYVRWVQTMLNQALNLRLPVSGVMDVPTRSAVRSFQEKNGLPVTGVVGPDTQQALMGGARPDPPPASTNDEPGNAGSTDGAPVTTDDSAQEEFFIGDLWNKLTGPSIIDRTSFSPKDKRKSTRDISKVYALVLHQMAFSRGSDPTKYDTVTAHYAILPDGKILQLHPDEAYLWASNGFNRGSVAVEFAGNFPSTRGKCWKPESFGCHQVTQAQIDSGRALIRHLIKKIGLTHVLAHRQSSGSRTNDPGPDIWYHVGQWAIDNHGLKDGGPGFKIDDGNPIPDDWRTWGQGKSQPELMEQLDPESPEHVRWLKQALNRTMGLRLPLTGANTPSVRSALRSFQRSHDLADDGELSEEVEEVLFAEGATPHRHPDFS